MSNLERKLIAAIRGTFAFFLILLFFSAAVTYAIQHDLPTALLFAMCGMAQMALEVAFPAKCCHPAQDTKGATKTPEAAFNATEDSTDDPNLEAIMSHPVPRRARPVVDSRQQ